MIAHPRPQINPIPWLRDPSPAGLLVLLTLLALASGAAIVARAEPAREPHPDQVGAVDAALAGWVEPAREPHPDQVGAVDAALAGWVEAAPRHPLRRVEYRRALARALVDSAEAHDLPVELLAAIALRESSGRDDARGPAGEVGVLQVHPDTAARYRCHTDTIAGQVDCGARVLAAHRTRCGDLPGALAAYASRSGSCSPRPGSRVARVVRDRLALAARLASQHLRGR